MAFELVSKYAPAGDQPAAIEALVGGIRDGRRSQVLMGVTGSRWPTSSPAWDGQLSCSPITRPLRPNSTASFASSFHTTRCTTSLATTTTTSPRLTSRSETSTSRKMPPSTRRSTACDWPPPVRWSAGKMWSWLPVCRASTVSAHPRTTRRW